MDTTNKPITCRAAVAMAMNSPFVVKTVTVDAPKTKEVRVKMASSGLCHSDLHFMEGMIPNYVFPSVLGHEGSGFIESVGPDVKDFAPGDLVVILWEGHCGDCAFCKHPMTNQCLKQPRDGLLTDGTARVHLEGKPLTQMTSVGTFSEYIVVSVNNVVKVNQKAPANRLCLAGCCIPTGYGAAMECAKVKPGSTCAIYGLGGVGMNVVLGCRDSKAAKIIGIDINPNKFEMAKKFGCTDVLNPKDLADGVPKAIAAMTNGGVDYCFVSVGIIPVMEEAIASSHPMWGQVIIVGLTDFGTQMKVGIWDLVSGRQLKGCYYGNYKAKLAIPGIVDKVVDGSIPLDKMISKTIPLDQINEGFDLMKKGDVIRTIIDFDLKN